MLSCTNMAGLRLQVVDRCMFTLLLLQPVILSCMLDTAKTGIGYRRWMQGDWPGCLSGCLQATLQR